MTDKSALRRVRWEDRLNFNADGYLEAGFHDMELDGIIEHFVTAFPTSATRQNIIEGYQRHCDDVRSIGVSCTQFIDGSFVSNKADPGDIDMVGCMDLDTVDALSPAEQAKLSALFSGPATKATHMCDAYFLPTAPQGHPAYDQLRSKRKYWMGEFGYDREDKPKGMVRTVVELPASASASEDDNA